MRFLLALALCSSAAFAQFVGPDGPPVPKVPPVPVASSPTTLPTPTAPAATVANCPAEPVQFVSVGGGAAGTKHYQLFGYYSMSQRVACGLYTTEINEYARGAGGTIVTCQRGGLSKVLQRFGPFAVGVVGDAGACEATTGNAGGAVGERAFLTSRLGRSNLYFVATVESLKVAGSGPQKSATIGFAYGAPK